MSTATMTSRKKPGFQFQPMAQAKRQNPEANGRLSHIILSMASDERVIENTPSLRKLREILQRPIP